MKKLIRLNPWIVLFLFVMPLFFPASAVGNIFTAVWTGFIAIYFYSFAHALYERLPAGHDLNLRSFDFNLILSAVFFIVVLTAVGGKLPSDRINFTNFNFLSLVIIPVKFLASFGTIYCVYWVAKCIVTIELGRRITFESFAPAFFLIMVFPIGLFWFLPRVRSILRQNGKI